MKRHTHPTTVLGSFSRAGAASAIAAIALFGIAQPALAQEAPPELYWDQQSTELPEWVRDQVIYEVNVRQFTPKGTFKAMQAHLQRLADLGVNTLWFMPIHPIGEVNRKGELGSYYAVKDYYGVNPEFGTPEDFKALIKAAHGVGMRVIIDWVGNHTAWDNPLTQEHPEFFELDAEGKLMPPKGTDWTDVVQLDLEAPGLLEYQIGAMRYWIEDFGIDGFRCDFATGVPTPFWNELSAALQEVKPDIFMLAEAAVPDHQLEAFHAAYAWDLLHAMEEVAQGKENAIYLDAVLNERHLLYPEGSDFLMMTSNHDENSWAGTVFQRFGGGAKAFAVLSMTMDGIPLIYNGQEVGLDKRLEFFVRDPIEWTPSAFTDFYKKLIDLKKTSAALATGAPSERIPTTADEAIYAYIRGEKGGAEVLVISNLTAKDNTFSIGSPRIAGEWTDLFSGESVTLDKSDGMTLQSWGYKVLYR